MARGSGSGRRAVAESVATPRCGGSDESAAIRARSHVARGSAPRRRTSICRGSRCASSLPIERPTPGAWRNCSSTSTAAKRTRPRRRERSRRVLDRRSSRTRCRSGTSSVLRCSCGSVGCSFTVNTSPMSMSSLKSCDDVPTPRVTWRWKNDALRLIVLSNLWQGSLERADEALRRHDELSDAGTRLPVIGSSELLIARNRLDEALRRFGWSDLRSAWSTCWTTRTRSSNGVDS